jgi:hypothetical protein
MIPKYALNSLPGEIAEILREHLVADAVEQLLSFTAASRFLHARQIAALCSGNELPSLEEMISGELFPHPTLSHTGAAGKVWAWAKKLVESGEFVLVELFRHQPTFLARPLWPVLRAASVRDPAKAWQARHLSTAAYQIARFIQESGPCGTADLQERLPGRFPILPGSLKKGLRELEEKLVIYPKRLADRYDNGQVLSWELLPRGLEGTADGPSGDISGAVVRLVQAVVQAAGVVDPREADRWFPAWKRQSGAALKHLKRAEKVRSLQMENAQVLISTSIAKLVPLTGS